MVRRHRSQSPLVLTAVIGLHAMGLGLLLQYQPNLSAASAEVMHVSLVTLPPAPAAVQPPAPSPRLEAPVPHRRIQRAITAHLPQESAIETAISAPSAPPEPALAVASAATEPPAAPAPPAPVVLPRFDADYLQNPPPAYPALSRRIGEHGRVLLRVVVRPDGTPESVELRQSSGSPRLDEAALDAVRKWRFVPARRGDVPITAAVIVPIVFALEG